MLTVLTQTPLFIPGNRRWEFPGRCWSSQRMPGKERTYSRRRRPIAKPPICGAANRRN
jgi:hypothetical protein